MSIVVDKIHRSGRAALIVVVGLGCHGAVERPSPSARSCVVGDDVDSVPESITIGVSTSVGVAEPTREAGDGDGIVHHQLYESLTEVDCNGVVRPGLASEWASHFGGREWRFTLRPDASYWDGVSVSIVDVIESWERNWKAIESSLPEGEYFNVADAISYDRIVVRLAEPDPDFPRRLARPELAVSRPRSPGDEWAVGTGPYRPAEGREVDGSVTLTPLDGERPRIRVVPTGGLDTRDAMDAGLDAVVGRERQAIDYANGRRDYIDVPLVWDATYALVVSDVRSDETSLPDAVMRLRSEIATDVVSIDARPSTCGSTHLGRLTADGGKRQGGDLVYALNDGSARAIAERLLAITSDRPLARALGLAGVRRVAPVDPATLSSVMQLDGVVGAVVRYSPVLCDEAFTHEIIGSSVPVIPLIDTRRHMFLRANVRVEVRADGRAVLFPPARQR